MIRSISTGTRSHSDLANISSVAGGVLAVRSHHAGADADDSALNQTMDKEKIMPKDEKSPRAGDLTVKVIKMLEGEKLGDVLLVGVGVLSNVIKQAKPEDREMLVPVMEMFFKKLTEITKDAAS